MQTLLEPERVAANDPPITLAPVSLTHYAEIDCRRDKLAMCRSVQALHACRAEGAGLALAFPGLEMGGEKPSVGPTLRAFGDLDNLERFLAHVGIRAMLWDGFIQIAEPAPVPATAGAVRFFRARPHKLSSAASLDRLDRRARLRRREGRGYMEEDDLRQRRVQAKSMDFGSRFPSLRLRSVSEERLFDFCVGMRSAGVASDGFGTYGLSDGIGAVPEF